MLPEGLIASFLIICLACFCSVNLHNILIIHKRKEKGKSYAEVEGPSNFIVSITTFGTLLYFLEACLYVFAAFSSIIPSPSSLPLTIEFPFEAWLQVLGLIAAGTGYSLFIWSVIARGKYASSWEMQADHKLITWGPYRFMRHPSYFGYFLMFLGFVAMWPNIFTLAMLVAIPGYARATVKEEKLLELRFGNKYKEYQRKTGRFFPKFQQPAHEQHRTEVFASEEKH